ncbi:MAG TPA: DUF2971 domain-containing protein [Solirubrobacteraceae bacterium]|nr:DUF2971 domain-containing protein [Solirubrobacteraceae bacterium]
MDLMQPDRYFYHYTTWHTASEHILPTGQLRLSPYHLMSDPLEAEAPAIGAGVTLPPGDDEALRESGLAHVEAQAILSRLRQNSKLLSLGVDSPWATQIQDSDRRFGMGWARSPLWQHYADNHRGVCLIFDREKLTRTVEAQLTERHPDSRSGAVRYSKTGLAGEHHVSLSLNVGLPGADQGRRHLRQYASQYFFVKLIDWENEHEFRFVEVSEDDGYAFVVYGDALGGMMLGHKFPEELEEIAVDLATDTGIEISQILWAFNGPMEGVPRAKVRRDHNRPEWLNPDGS